MKLNKWLKDHGMRIFIVTMYVLYASSWIIHWLNNVPKLEEIKDFIYVTGIMSIGYMAATIADYEYQYIMRD